MLIIPLGKQGSDGIPIVTLFVCVACVILQVFASAPTDRLALAFHPGQLDPLKMFTSVFLHAGIWHLLGNLFFFYCFARTIEARFNIAGFILAFVVFVLVTNLAYAATALEPIPTLGLSGVVWGFMGMFLFRYPRDRIECWVLFINKIEVPASFFILAFLSLDIAAYRHTEVATVNYVAHFSGFAAGALFKLAFWNTFTTENPAPRRKAPYPSRLAHGRAARR
ncbi:MAG TPA: rhomboid family intramembrane serine protease [Steroidobacteraceae bacterium]|nr:rhomboid family intramembrane serine protease [Steroidobacteraceae bacterium]